MEAMPDTKAKNLWLERYRAQSGKSTTTILLNAYSNENDSSWLTSITIGQCVLNPHQTSPGDGY